MRSRTFARLVAVATVASCNAGSGDDSTEGEDASAPPEELAVDRCITGDESLLDLVPEDMRDRFECEFEGGSSNGRLPAGITIDRDTCKMVGTISEDRFGTWAFIVRGRRGGTEIFAPYCVTQPDAGFEYEVDVAHSGMASGVLTPIVRQFDPEAPLAVGGAGDPLFSITHPDSCDTGCFFGFSFGLNSSAFDPSTFAITNREPVLDGSDPIGFSHEIEISGPPVPGELRDRPWVQNVSLDYCLARDGQTCSGSAATLANGDGHLETAILMFPAGS